MNGGSHKPVAAVEHEDGANNLFLSHAFVIGKRKLFQVRDHFPQRTGSCRKGRAFNSRVPQAHRASNRYG
jgi:hypothetical protein